MTWVVDTCLLIDVAEADACFSAASAELRQSTFPLRTGQGRPGCRLLVFIGRALGNVLANLDIPCHRINLEA